jgi:hypothetical protein
MLDGRTMEWTQIRVGRHAACSVCAERPSISQPTIGPVGETH